MANQTVTADSNHDDLTGRLAGEDFTINNGATLMIDSMPHLTPMGILGDFTLNDGTIHIDGTRTYEVTYSGGSGSLPGVSTAISWASGTQTGKIIALNAGDAISGTLTLTVDVGSTAPTDADAITDGAWSADLDTVKIGYLLIYGEDQDWGAVDGRSTLRITGDWYEVGVGDGTDSQVITLPHTGQQHAVWIETGSGTGVFEIWHRVASGASTVYYAGTGQWGGTFESGFVFIQTIGSATLTFGTAAAGGAPPLGARIRIPNVHIGTTTTAAPTTEVNLAAVTSGINLVAPNVNLNVEIDHLNASTSVLAFRGTNQVTVTDTCWAYATSSNLINKVNAAVYIGNSAIIYPSVATTGGIVPSIVHGVTDNVGDIVLDNVVIMGGTAGGNGAAFVLTTMANIAFTGRCKLVLNRQNENTMSSLRGSVAVNVSAETLICLGGAIVALAGCNNWSVDEFIFGLPPGRGTAEQNINPINLTGTQTVSINSGRQATGSKMPTAQLALLTDATDTTIRNFGSITSKISGASRLTGVVNLAGVTTGVRLQQLWFTTLNTTSAYQMINSVANVTIENCSGDYDDEIEIDANRVLVKGLHGASGAPDAATGVEGDLVNCIGSVFLDYFKSNTTGAVGLIFNDRGNFHATDVTITAGTPLWNGLGDLLMRTSGDQVEFEWPYRIRGHTGFQASDATVSATNPANHSWEYAVDTGSGYGAWKAATSANLSGETISPSGFGLKVRVTCTTTSTSNAIKGFALLTTTTLADQEANLYPFAVVTISVTAQDAFTGAPIEGATVLLYRTTGSSATVTRSGSTATVTQTGHGYVSGQKVVLFGADQIEYTGIKTISNVTTNTYDFAVTGTPATPATGTITAHEVILSGETDSLGVLEVTDYAYSSSFAVSGRIRKNTASPRYVGTPISGTVTDTGLSILAAMVSDE